MSSVLTYNSVDDVEKITQVLIDINRGIGNFYGDRAYDEKKSRKAVILPKCSISVL